MKKYTGPFVGGSRQGGIKTTFAKLKEVFGEPHFVNLCEKVDYEWKFELTDGSVVSIYPYKYSPKENQLFEFSVASNSKKSADALIAHFNSVVGE